MYKEAIMASRLEDTKDYLVSVAERTFGVDAYQRWQGYAETQLDGDARRLKRITGTIFGFGQFLFPAITRWMVHEYNREPHLIPMVGRGVTVGAIDCATLLILQNQYNIGIPEAVVFKLITNMATHALIDTVGFGMDRIGNLRPPAPTTLAV